MLLAQNININVKIVNVLKNITISHGCKNKVDILILLIKSGQFSNSIDMDVIHCLCQNNQCELAYKLIKNYSFMTSEQINKLFLHLSYNRKYNEILYMLRYDDILSLADGYLIMIEACKCGSLNVLQKLFIFYPVISIIQIYNLKSIVPVYHTTLYDFLNEKIKDNCTTDKCATDKCRCATDKCMCATDQALIIDPMINSDVQSIPTSVLISNSN